MSVIKRLASNCSLLAFGKEYYYANVWDLAQTCSESMNAFRFVHPRLHDGVRSADK